MPPVKPNLNLGALKPVILGKRVRWTLVLSPRAGRFTLLFQEGSGGIACGFRNVTGSFTGGWVCLVLANSLACMLRIHTKSLERFVVLVAFGDAIGGGAPGGGQDRDRGGNQSQGNEKHQ